MTARLAILTPERDAALRCQAGFAGVEPLYGAFTFRGWVARA